jgi:S-DNA-T family DNA segregation ATPase FtsK/SpoIIIE
MEPTEDEHAKKQAEELGRFDPRAELPAYSLPILDLLGMPPGITVDAAQLELAKEKIVDVFGFGGVEVDRIAATVGPSMTIYELSLAPGSMLARIRRLQPDLELSLAAHVRIVAPIPGKSTIAIEVLHTAPLPVRLYPVLAAEKFLGSDAELPVVLGKTMDNRVHIADLVSLPHLLLSGATGQGKSMALHALLLSLLYKKHPGELKLVLIDINNVELGLYRKLERHFLAGLPGQRDAVIGSVAEAVDTLEALIREMDARYGLFSRAGVKRVKEYNAKFIERKLDTVESHRYLPYLVVVIDEFADLLSARRDAEGLIGRLAQQGRPAGIHLVIATQRPSVNIITGTIKANFISRLAFRVASATDSRTILDRTGAELLHGQGDALLLQGIELIHLQGVLVETEEIERVVDFIGAQHGKGGLFLLREEVNNNKADQEDKDPFFEEAARLVAMHQQASPSLIQRKLKLGYTRAGVIIDQLEQEGIIGPFDGVRPRDVLFDSLALEEKLSGRKPVVQRAVPEDKVETGRRKGLLGFFSKLFR